MDAGVTSSQSASDATAAPAQHFDVFLSHSSEDKPAVLRLAKELKQAGLEPWFDQWYLAGGGFWQEDLARALKASSACAVFIGPQGLGDWAREELAVAQNRAARDRGFRLVPVLLPGVPDPFDPTAVLPPFLSTRTWVDLRGRRLDDPDALQLLINAVKGVAIGPGGGERKDDRPPYRGLQAFDEEHADLFFGRDGDVQRLLEKLKGSRFLAVLGPSGSGKSSLVRAGLVPALRQGRLPSSASWPIRVFTPGARPIEELALLVTGLRGSADPLGDARQVQDHLRSDSQALHLAVRIAMGADATITTLLVVDQAEEMFTLCRDETERSQFLANLVYAASVPNGPCAVVLTLRADFYHRCAAYPDLASQLAAQQFLVSPMPPEALRQVIEEPAQRAGLEFEEGLVDAILEDVAEQPGALPLLEHALWELWQRRRGRMLTLEGYRASGGVAGALAKRADEVYAGLSEIDQSIARRVLLRLTEPGEGTEDTRRRAIITELITRSGERPAVEEVVQALTAARLLTTGGDEQTGEQVVDVAHEALIRGWPRLRAWIDEDRQGLRVQRRLTEAAQDWQRANRDEGLLYRGARLAEATEWRPDHEAELNDDERAFVDASVALVNRERSRARRRVMLTIGGLVLFGVAVSGLAVFASVQAQVAAAGELLASASAELAVDPQVSMLQAMQAYRASQTPEAEDAVREAFAASHMLRVLRGHTRALTTVTFSPDGQRVLTASQDGTARVWDASSGAQKFTVGVDGGSTINAAEFSPDGSRIVAGGADGTVRVWDAATGAEETNFLVREKANVFVARFDGQGQRVVVATDGEKSAYVWELESNHQVKLTGHTGRLTDARFSPDGAWVVTASQDKTAIVWNARDGTQVATGALRHDQEVSSATFSPNDARILVTTSRDGSAKVWDTRSWRLLANLRGHLGQVNGAVFSGDGVLLATRSDDWTTHVWDLSQRSLEALGDVDNWPALLKFELRGFAGEMTAVAFSADGALIATSSEDKTARLWDASRDRAANKDRIVSELRGHSEPVVTVAFSPDGRRVVTASADGTARIWDSAAGRSLVSSGLQGKLPEGVLYLAGGGRVVARSRNPNTNGFSPVQLFEAPGLQPVADLERDANKMLQSRSGDRLLTLSGSHGVTLYDATTGAVIRPLPDMATAAFSADGKLVVTGGGNGSVEVWETSNAQARQLNSRPDGHRIISLDVDRGGQRVVTTSGTGTGQQTRPDPVARVWGTAGGAPVGLDHTGAVQSATLSPDGRSVLTLAVEPGGGGVAVTKTVRVWDISDGSPTVRWARSQPQAQGVVFSPDGARVVVQISGSDLVRLWDAQTGRPIAEDLGPVDADACRVTASPGQPNGCQFSPDGKLLVASARDSTPGVWDLTTGRLVRTLFGDTQGAKRVAFSPDGAFFATAGDNGILRVWLTNPTRPAADQPLLVLRAHAKRIRAVVFSPDGSHIVTAGNDELDQVSAEVFACEVCSPLPRLVEQACARLERDLSHAELQSLLTTRTLPVPLLDRLPGPSGAC